MSLDYFKSKIGNYKKISTLKIVTGDKLIISQTKASLDEIEGVNADMNYQCPVSCETGAVKMECGHNAGVAYMTQLVRSIVADHRYIITCSEKD